VTVVESKDGSLSVSAPRVTPNIFFDAWHEALAWAHFLTEAEGQPGGPPVVILSEGLWRQSFNADRRLLATLRIGGVASIVVGVMPQTMRFPEETWSRDPEGGVAARAANAGNDEKNEGIVSSALWVNCAPELA